MSVHNETCRTLNLISTFLFLHVYNAYVCLMVFNATFNNMSSISWRSVLLVEETAIPGENHRPVAEQLYYVMSY
jgi:energy-converting hydrogenase Eha subunit E